MSARLLDQLRRTAFDEAGPLPPVQLRPGEAVGHFLREDLLALSDLPATEISTVAGWAVAGPGPWRLLSESAVAQAAAAGHLPDGYAMAVDENAALLPGTSAVVRETDAHVADGRLVAGSVIGDHVLARGAECAAGTLLLPQGTLLTPGAAALATAGGHPDVRVTAHPTVAFVVVQPQPPGPEQGTDPVLTAPGDLAAAMLPSLTRAAGAADVATRQVPDTSVGLRSMLDAVRAELVVVAGGSRTARSRHLDAYLQDERADVVVEGSRDGTGLVGAQGWLLARLRDGRLLVALPGDVRWSVAGFLTLVRPLVRGMCGFDAEPFELRTAEQPIVGDPTGTSFVFVRGGAASPDHGPATGHGVTAADGVALVPPLGLRPGETFEVLPV